MNEERLSILRMVKEGKITPEEGVELLEALKSEKPTLTSEPSKAPGIAEVVGEKLREKLRGLKHEDAFPGPWLGKRKMGGL